MSAVASEVSPSLRGDHGDLAGGHLRQAREHAAEVGLRVDPAAAAAFDDGVEDGSALASVRGSEEQPVLFVGSGGADGVFHAVVVDLNASVGNEVLQFGPAVQGVGAGFAQGALWKGAAPDAFQCGADAAQDRGALESEDGLAQLRTGIGRAQSGFDTVEQGDLIEQPAAGVRDTFSCLEKAV